MTKTELEIRKKVHDEKGELNAPDRDFIERLMERQSAAPISSKIRSELYRLGKLFGLDGRRMFAAEIQERKDNAEQLY